MVCVCVCIMCAYGVCVCVLCVYKVCVLRVHMVCARLQAVVFDVWVFDCVYAQLVEAGVCGRDLSAVFTCVE